MKRIKYLFLTILLCSAFTACDNKEDNLTLETSKIEVKVSAETPQSAGGKEISAASAGESKLLLTSDEIVSYNAKSGEIIFKNIKRDKESELYYELVESLLKYANKSGKLEFYKDGNLLFKLKLVSDECSAIYNFPVLYFGNWIVSPETGKMKQEDESNFYIFDGYGGGMPLGKRKMRKPDNTMDKERIENVKKISDGWNIFIETLKKEGKYIK